MTEPRIEYDQNGNAVGFIGKEAVDLYRAATLASALKLKGSTGLQVARNANMTQMLKMATEYTGNKYKRTRPECLRAAEDLSVMIQAVKAMIPTETRD